MDALIKAFDFLIHPTFFDPDNPPVKLNINAKTMGLVAAILGALGVLLFLIAIPGVLLIGAVVSSAYALTGQQHDGILVVAMVGLILGLITDLIWTYGGWKLYNDDPKGRDIVIVSLGLSTIASLVYDFGHATLGSFFFTIVFNGVIYYLVRISRLPSEGQLTPATATGADPWVPTAPAPGAPPAAPPAYTPPSSDPGGEPPTI